MPSIPHKQQAVQLVGPDQLLVNSEKPIVSPGPHQVLARVEAVGLCFSDLKLLKQFSKHARKSIVASGLDAKALSEMPNYVPGDKPAVPGHEAVVRIVGVGPGVTRHQPGERFLVQTDYRWLPTASSNAAFGYNFEGALQEYVLLDERVIVSPDGESMLIPVPEDLAGSALALVEPWACVENAYVEVQRRTLKDGGKTLVVSGADARLISDLPGNPATVRFAAPGEALGDETFDDILYYGADAATLEELFPHLAPAGLIVIVQGGRPFDRQVVAPVGRIHYGGIRIVGTAGHNIMAAFDAIPKTAEICPNDRINIVGAAGPMGSMHVLRVLCQGVGGIEVYASDLNDERLDALRKLAEPVARRNRLSLTVTNPTRDRVRVSFKYIVLMAPVPSLIPPAIASADTHAIINIFAGIPAEISAPIDLDSYIQKQLYFVGTSGSTLDDMKSVLAKVVARQLDTNLLVAAVSGLDGAIDGIRAVEKNLLSGKIVVYPSCRGMPLKPLEKLAGDLPLENGHWNKGAEEALLKQYGSQ
jgi:threonine dehydrogenase-like Zn-dependent dehydrogenase